MAYDNLLSAIELIYSIFVQLYNNYIKNNTENNTESKNNDIDNEVVFNEIYRNSLKLDNFENNNINRTSFKRNSINKINITEEPIYFNQDEHNLESENIKYTDIYNDISNILELNIDKEKIKDKELFSSTNVPENTKENIKKIEEDKFWTNYYQNET